MATKSEPQPPYRPEIKDILERNRGKHIKYLRQDLWAFYNSKEWSKEDYKKLPLEFMAALAEHKG